MFFKVVFVISMLQIDLAPLLPNLFSEISCEKNVNTILILWVFSYSTYILLSGKKPRLHGIIKNIFIENVSINMKFVIVHNNTHYIMTKLGAR